MLCPNCGRVLDETAIMCKYCGSTLSSSRELLHRENEVPSDSVPAAEFSVNNMAKSKFSVRWVGPRRTAHICAIIAGLAAIYDGFILCAYMNLLQDFSADIPGMQFVPPGVWTILFGILLVVFGIIGLVKIHSGVSCAVLSVLHLLLISPFSTYYKDLLASPDIFIAFWASACVMLLSFGAIMKEKGVISGWILLIFVIVCAIYVYVHTYDTSMDTGYNALNNEVTQNENMHDPDTEQTKAATVTPIPKSSSQISYNWQETNDSIAYDEDEEIDDDSEHIFPNSNCEYLTKADVKGKSAEELNLAKNELYARHGRIFDREDLQEYFEGCNWYEPLYTREEWDEKGDKYFFNKVEIKNRNFLVEQEKKAK